MTEQVVGIYVSKSAYNEIKRLKGINADLLAALEEVTEWISNWSPNFTEDDEWQETADKIDAALIKAKGIKE